MFIAMRLNINSGAAAGGPPWAPVTSNGREPPFIPRQRRLIELRMEHADLDDLIDRNALLASATS